MTDGTQIGSGASSTYRCGGGTSGGLSGHAVPHGAAGRAADGAHRLSGSGTGLGDRAMAGRSDRWPGRWVFINGFRGVGAEHIQQPWADGWRCWLCPRWGKQPLTGTCVRLVDVSLQFVPGSIRRRRTRSRQRWGGG